MLRTLWGFARSVQIETAHRIARLGIASTRGQAAIAAAEEAIKSQAQQQISGRGIAHTQAVGRVTRKMADWYEIGLRGRRLQEYGRELKADLTERFAAASARVAAVFQPLPAWILRILEFICTIADGYTIYIAFLYFGQSTKNTLLAATAATVTLSIVAYIAGRDSGLKSGAIGVSLVAVGLVGFSILRYISLAAGQLPLWKAIGQTCVNVVAAGGVYLLARKEEDEEPQRAAYAELGTVAAKMRAADEMIEEGHAVQQKAAMEIFKLINQLETLAEVRALEVQYILWEAREKLEELHLECAVRSRDGNVPPRFAEELEMSDEPFARPPGMARDEGERDASNRQQEVKP